MATKRFSAILTLVVICASFIALPAHGQIQLVPSCQWIQNIQACGICELYQLADNILQFIYLFLLIPLGIIMLIYAGFLMISASFTGSESGYTNGKKILIRVIIGICIVLFSWIIIDAIIKILANQNLAGGPAQIFGRPWNQVNCAVTSVAAPPVPAQSPVVTQPPAGTAQPAGPSCTNCVTLASVGVNQGGNPCCGGGAGGTCQINQALASQLGTLNQSILATGRPPNYWVVTEAWPPTVNHLNPCHVQGTCVDANFTSPANRGNPADIIFFINQAKAAGLDPVFEVSTQLKLDQLVAAGVPAGNIIRANITGEHFSLYSPGISNRSAGGAPFASCVAGNFSVSGNIPPVAGQPPAGGGTPPAGGGTPPADTTPPTVSITGPAVGASVQGTVIITASASDNVGVSRVDFFVDGTAVGSDSSSPFSTVWSTAAISEGPHTITATAFDIAGNSTNAAPVTVTVSNADTIPPTITNLNPANGSTVTSPLTVSAVVSDNVGPQKVEIILDGTTLLSEVNNLGFIPNGTYGIAWNPSTVPDGQHAILFRATDFFGNQSQQTTSFTVAVPPTVAINSPLNNSTVNGPVTINASASDNSGIASIQFIVDGVTIQTLPGSAGGSYTAQWNASTATDGLHAIQVLATDTAGNQNTASIRVIVSAPPVVTVTAPSNGATVLGTISLGANITDNTGVQTVEFLIDGALLQSMPGTGPSGSYTALWNTTTATNGTHTITIRATDVAGIQSASSVNITVAN